MCVFGGRGVLFSSMERNEEEEGRNKKEIYELKYAKRFTSSLDMED